MAETIIVDGIKVKVASFRSGDSEGIEILSTYNNVLIGENTYYLPGELKLLQKMIGSNEDLREKVKKELQLLNRPSYLID